MSTLAVSVHGTAGVLDLVVPRAALPGDLIGEYARATATAPAPGLRDRLGTALDPALTLDAAGVVEGALLVLGDPPPVSPDRSAAEVCEAVAGGPAVLQDRWPVVVAAAAVVLVLAVSLAAPWTSSNRSGVVGVLALLGASVVAALAPGRWATPRRLGAPVAGGGVAVLAFALHDGGPSGALAILSAAAFGAALVAAAGLVLEVSGPTRAGPGLRVWLAATTFVVAVAAVTLGLGWRSQVAWSVLLVVAVLAARAMPALVLDVPDTVLLDDELADTARTARATPRRVSPSSVNLVELGRRADAGARGVLAAAVAVAVIALLSAPLVLESTLLPVDRYGAPVLVALAGGALLLLARGHRHLGARLSLSLAGLGCLGSVVVLVLAEQAWFAYVGIVCMLLGVAVVGVAIARGRGLVLAVVGPPGRGRGTRRRGRNVARAAGHPRSFPQNLGDRELAVSLVDAWVADPVPGRDVLDAVRDPRVVVHRHPSITPAYAGRGTDMSNLNLETSQLASAAAAVGQTSVDVTLRSANLHAAVADLASGWQGASGSAFQVLMAQWDQRMTTVTRALSDLGEALGATGQTTAAADDAETVGYHSLAATLGA